MSAAGFNLSNVGQYIVKSYGGLQAVTDGLRAINRVGKIAGAVTLGLSQEALRFQRQGISPKLDPVLTQEALGGGTREEHVTNPQIDPRFSNDGTSRFLCHWHPVEGLAPEELFLIQKIDFNMRSATSPISEMFFIIAGKPWEATGPRPDAKMIDGGEAAATGSDDLAENLTLRRGISLSPGDPFDFGVFGMTVEQMFGLMLRQNPFFYAGDGGHVVTDSATKQIDLTPNYIAVKSYWTAWHVGPNDSTAQEPPHWLKFYGKVVKMDIEGAISA